MLASALTLVVLMNVGGALASGIPMVAGMPRAAHAGRAGWIRAPAVVVGVAGVTAFVFNALKRIRRSVLQRPRRGRAAS